MKFPFIIVIYDPDINSYYDIENEDICDKLLWYTIESNNELNLLFEREFINSLWREMLHAQQDDEEDRKVEKKYEKIIRKNKNKMSAQELLSLLGKKLKYYNKKIKIFYGKKSCDVVAMICGEDCYKRYYKFIKHIDKISNYTLNVKREYSKFVQIMYGSKYKKLINYLLDHMFDPRDYESKYVIAQMYATFELI